MTVFTFSIRNLGLSLMAGGLLLVNSPAADAQTLAPVAMSFEQAQQQLSQASNALKSAAYSTQAAQAEAEANANLWQPVVTLESQALRYQKSLEVPLNGVKSDLLQLNTALGTDAEKAVEHLANSLPHDARIRKRDNVFSATVNVIQPLYAGGAIVAAQKAAKSAAELVQAQELGVQDKQRFNLVTTYFAQVLAQQHFNVTQAHLAGFEQHLKEAQILEREGMIPHSRTLEVIVARDTALIANQRAYHDLLTASDELSSLLEQPTPIATQTPLFVNLHNLESVEHYVQVALQQQPLLQQADAGYKIAEQQVALAKSERLPKLFAMGSYALDRNDQLLTQPDWVVGVGLSYTLNASTNRNRAVTAANLRLAAAEHSKQQAQSEVRSAVIRAYNSMNTARSEFFTLQSSLNAAEENLRVQQVAFREGEATATAIIDARNALSRAQLQRAVAAFQYDTALSALLTASGQGARFNDYILRADAKVMP